MRAYVYVIKRMGVWRAYATISPDIDRMFWMHAADGARLGRKGEAAAQGWLRQEPLPLGDACRAAERWNKERGYRDDDVLGRLAECVASVREAAAGSAAETGLRGLGAKAERWEREVRAERAGGDAELEAMAAGARLAAELMQGRALLRNEAQALLEGATWPGGIAANLDGMLQLAAVLGLLRLRGSIALSYGRRMPWYWQRRRELRCLRCGSGEEHMRTAPCASCGRECAYCVSCIQMGRSRECELLIEGLLATGTEAAEDTRSSAPAQSSSKPLQQQLRPVEERLAAWKLSPAQFAAAASALRFVESPSGEPQSRQLGQAAAAQLGIRSFLLWAVTGAGKTEMIFPLVESVLLRGGRALIATPRRDVVIELDPRIRKAFPTASVVTLYGGSEQRWERGDITLSTTHQLLRFQESFDLVVIDELDAFPYAGDPVLHYAADKCCSPGAARLLLSATPPPAMQRAAKRGVLPHARVPVRYHRHPLPVPKLLQVPAVAKLLQKRRLPAALLSALRQSVQRGAQLFVFVQCIAHTEPMAELLRGMLRNAEVAATSSQDPDRTGKVQRFRKGEIRVLVTTTILERGVTIPRSDVYILDADGRLFDEASLVQMAGRAGRSADDPCGRVYFCSPERNRPQKAAIRHIRAMNKLACKSGYLLPDRTNKEASL